MESRGQPLQKSKDHYLTHNNPNLIPRIRLIQSQSVCPLPWSFRIADYRQISHLPAMTSSSVSTEGADTKATTPPDGWTINTNAMMKSDYWAGTSDDVKSMLQTDYGLQSVEPLWRHEPKYGTIMFIFQATASGTTLYYVWNGLESSVCRFVETSIDNIKKTINDKGKGAGYLKDLQQVVVQPLS